MKNQTVAIIQRARGVRTFKSNQNGDTLVEVLLATVILSAVIASAYSLTLTATQINQDSIERTQVVQYLQEQAELLRVARASDTGASSSPWTNILNNKLVLSDPAFDCSATDFTTFTPLGFHLLSQDDGSGQVEIVVVNGAVQKPNTAVSSGIFYIWIDAVDKAPSYNDFIVNACWEGLSNNVNQQSGIVIRLEPN